MSITNTPPPPYYAVIFTSVRSEGDHGYSKMAEEMVQLGYSQPGFLGADSARDAEGTGITVSYWDSLESINNWKGNLRHREAQKFGREMWYKSFMTRICKVERQDFFQTSTIE